MAIPAKEMPKTRLRTLFSLRGIPHTDQAMNTYPQICTEIGLDCNTCIEGTARNLAKVCKGLRGKMIGQMFVQIYTDPACSRMHAHFAVAYEDASSETRPRAMAAVA
jgi:hypothetical protein